MPLFPSTRTKKRSWNTLDDASAVRKDELLKDLISSADQECLYDVSKIDKWFSVVLSEKISIFSLLYQLKDIEESIRVYVDINSKSSLPEIIITSKEYKKAIFDNIVDLIMEHEKKIQKTIEFFYVAEEQFQGNDNMKEI